MKEFNTTGVCIPSKHYMVDLTKRVQEIKKMIDAGKYFCINRGRQYGKTTTIYAIRNALKEEYTTISLDFQGIGNAGFENEGMFSRTLSRRLLDLHEFEDFPIPEDTLKALEDISTAELSKLQLSELFRVLKRWMKKSDKPLILIIDEVDSATNNQVFLDFLSLLREGYIARDTEHAPAFQSVILVGVTDIRYLKAKLREEDRHRVNSPWNIAADFNIDMSLSKEGICGMLAEYEADHATGMDVAEMARILYDYTGGYPFLVSRLCQLIDLFVSRQMPPSEAWSRSGMDEAVKLILSESNTLFQSVTAKLFNNPKLKDSIHSILMEGDRIAFNPLQEEIVQLQMYGLIKNENGSVRIANRIFETILYNLFLSDEELKKSTIYREGEYAKNIFVDGGRLNMRLIMEHFIKTYTEVCGPLKDRFYEKDGREQFLLYLKPIINGTGNYYIEAQTRDRMRTDVIVDYLGEQYIIELKIWRGERYNEAGEKQIAEYLDYFHLQTGYMLSFNFNQKKEQGVKRVELGDKVLYEGTV